MIADIAMDKSMAVTSAEKIREQEPQRFSPKLQYVC